MTRLQQHRQKQITQRIITLILVFLVLMGIFFFVGLQSIINATVFMNNLLHGNSKTAQTSETDSDFYGLINLDEPEAATNSASLIVTGDASEFKKVEYYINNLKVENGDIKSDGTFTEEIGKLRVGDNKIYVVAKTSDNKHKKQSDSYTVTYMNEPPTLEIETPHDHDTVSKSEIQAKGKTDKGVSVSVNNQPVVVDFDGNFTATLRLKEGENKMEFSAVDIAGNEKKQELTIVYNKDE